MRTITSTNRNFSNLINQRMKTKTANRLLNRMRILTRRLLSLTNTIRNNLIFLTRLISASRNSSILRFLITLRGHLSTINTIMINLTRMAQVRSSQDKTRQVRNQMSTLKNSIAKGLNNHVRINRNHNQNQINMVVNQRMGNLRQNSQIAANQNSTLLGKARLVNRIQLMARNKERAARRNKRLKANLNRTRSIISRRRRILILRIARMLYRNRYNRQSARANAQLLVRLTGSRYDLLGRTNLNRFTSRVIALANALTSTDRRKRAAIILNRTLGRFLGRRNLTRAYAARRASLTTLRMQNRRISSLSTHFRRLNLKLRLVRNQQITIS